MKTRSALLLLYLVVCTIFIGFVPSIAIAQKDTVEFKFIPKFNPDENNEFVSLPQPKIVFKPEIVFPSDPKLKGKKAEIFVKALVNAKGKVHKAEVFKSTDSEFDRYALKYAKQFMFKLSDAAVHWIETMENDKGIWVSIPIRFKDDA